MAATSSMRNIRRRRAPTCGCSRSRGSKANAVRTDGSRRERCTVLTRRQVDRLHLRRVGNDEVYVQPYPPTGAKLQVSTDPAPFPRARWSSDGKELFYVSADYKLVSVGLTYRGGFVEAAPPKALFRVGWMYDYIPSRDGRRMLMLRMTNAPFAGPIDILLNWTAALTK